MVAHNNHNVFTTYNGFRYARVIFDVSLLRVIRYMMCALEVRLCYRVNYTIFFFTTVNVYYNSRVLMLNMILSITTCSL
jgi:hypothetical protein